MSDYSKLRKLGEDDRERLRHCSHHGCEEWAEYMLTVKTEVMALPGYYPLCEEHAQDGEEGTTS